MDHVTRRALTPVRAAKRREILDTTPTKKATKRWATLRPAKAPDPNLLGLTISPLSLSWSSLSKWKMRRCLAVPVITPPLMPLGSAAPQRALILPCTRPKQSAPDITWPIDLSPAAEAKPLLPHLLPELSPSVISWGTRDQEASCCGERNVLQLQINLRILYECLL